MYHVGDNQFDELRVITDADDMASFIILVSWLVLPVTAAAAPSVVEFYVREELPPGSYVGNLAADADVYRKYRPQVATTLRFRILFQSAPSAASSGGGGGGAAVKSSLFAVDQLTGDISTVVRVDREQYCPRAGQCAARVDFVVQPTAYFQIVRTRIHVVDINDNSPLFPTSVLNFAVAESQSADPAARSAGFRVPEADDPDGPAFAVQRYLVVSTTAELNDDEETSTTAAAEVPFAVNYGHGQLRVVPTAVLDRETVAR